MTKSTVVVSAGEGTDRSGEFRSYTLNESKGRGTTSGGPADVGRVSALDGWRGVACLLVFLYHTGANLWWPPLALFGFTGVHLFFVLSGYLISLPFVDSLALGQRFPSAAAFYARRALRVFPPYLVSLLFFITLRYVTRTHSPDPFNVLTHAALVFNYFRQVGYFSINAVYWSLAIEWQFYLLLPLVFGLWRVVLGSGAKGAAAAVLVTFLGVGIGSRIAEFGFAGASEVKFRTVFSYLDLFGAGIAVAYAHRFCAFYKAPGRRRLIGFIGIFIFVACNNWCLYAGRGDWLTVDNFWFTVTFPTLLCLGTGLMLLSVVTAPADGKGLLRYRPLVKIGAMSYSLYLYHIGVQHGIMRLLPPIGGYTTSSFIYAAAALIPTVALSALMFHVVERPSLAWAARFRQATGPQRAGARQVEPSAP
jgi:peptidoglycan/LPS O-acetylase OafA/YrhL